MPAIHPTRLKIRVAQLRNKLDQPEAFIRALHQILDDYADRTYRPGQSGEPPPLLSTYRTPAPVFREIDREIAVITERDLRTALLFVDALWAEPVIEFRLLATSLLGRFQPESWPVVTERVHAWLSTQPEDRVTEAILENGLRRIRTELPDRYLHMVEDWLKAERVFLCQTALRALIPVLADTSFDILPAVLRLLTPLIRIPPPTLRQDLVAVLRILVRRYPQEAIYVFRQSLSPDRPDTAWLIRQVVSEFPAEAQNRLRDILR